MLSSFSTVERCSGRVEGMLSEWSKVAVFFMLRLLLAPCVESVVLLDRLLFLREQGIYQRVGICVC